MYYEKEIERRRRSLYPPYTVLCRVLLTSREQSVEELTKAAEAMETEMRGYFARHEDAYRDIVQMRAMEAPVSRIKSESRAQLFLKLYNRRAIRAILDELSAIASRVKPPVFAALEINPSRMI